MSSVIGACSTAAALDSCTPSEAGVSMPLEDMAIQQALQNALDPQQQPKLNYTCLQLPSCHHAVSTLHGVSSILQPAQRCHDQHPR